MFLLFKINEVNVMLRKKIKKVFLMMQNCFRSNSLMGTSFWEWTWSSEGGAVVGPEIFLKNFFEIALLRMIVCYSTEHRNP